MNLEDLKIASPCSASWENMTGDHRVRFCDLCRKNVYNIASMTREEAQRLIVSKEGKLCARIYRRRDGNVLTADCPVGRKSWRKRFVLRAACILAILAAPFVSLFRESADLQTPIRSPFHERTMGAVAYTPMVGKVAIQPANQKLDGEHEELGDLGYAGQ